ncbi:hypothetical protein GUJ93_ZPchr0007g5961 [Zizania palustris]|uniref:Uncharacterized protein n=1 Tax=Zizania palustris TaxID=103762 RepID=A0A8J5TEM1_ZIZPA|nr:hypothetical protein GUJ93_ZPchr0007g5961 [Zizania palustris]
MWRQAVTGGSEGWRPLVNGSQERVGLWRLAMAGRSMIGPYARDDDGDVEVGNGGEVGDKSDTNQVPAELGAVAIDEESSAPQPPLPATERCSVAFVDMGNKLE